MAICMPWLSASEAARAHHTLRPLAVRMHPHCCRIATHLHLRAPTSTTQRGRDPIDKRRREQGAGRRGQGARGREQGAGRLVVSGATLGSGESVPPGTDCTCSSFTNAMRRCPMRSQEAVARPGNRARQQHHLEMIMIAGAQDCGHAGSVLSWKVQLLPCNLLTCAKPPSPDASCTPRCRATWRSRSGSALPHATARRAA